MRGKTLKASPLGEAQHVEKPPSAREVPRRGGGREPCHSPKYFATAQFSPPPPAGGAPSQRGPRGEHTFFDSLGFPLGGSCPQGGLMRGELTAVTRLWAATAAFPSSGLGRGLGHLPPQGKALCQITSCWAPARPCRPCRGAGPRGWSRCRRPAGGSPGKRSAYAAGPRRCCSACGPAGSCRSHP